MSSKKICPEHGTILESKWTRYGTRYSCPQVDCTVAAWSGSTSTPADQETREARIRAHNAFDQLWKSGRYRRSHAYSLLAEFMGLSKSQTHIGMFDKEQCAAVVRFVERLKEPA